jgi:hypothetical protein
VRPRRFKKGDKVLAIREAGPYKKGDCFVLMEVRDLRNQPNDSPDIKQWLGFIHCVEQYPTIDHECDDIELGEANWIGDDFVCLPRKQLPEWF